MNKNKFISVLGTLLIALVLFLNMSSSANAQDYDEASENSDATPSQVTAGTYTPSAAEWAMLDAVNSYRAANGIAPVQMSRSLAGAARHHAYYMSRSDDVDHTLGSVSWSQNIANFGYPTTCAIGENVAAGRSSASGTLQQFKDSPPHNANVLDPNWTRIGIGRVYYSSGAYDYYWALDFGSCSHRTIYQ